MGGKSFVRWLELNLKSQKYHKFRILKNRIISFYSFHVWKIYKWSLKLWVFGSKNDFSISCCFLFRLFWKSKKWNVLKIVSGFGKFRFRVVCFSVSVLNS